MPLRMRLRRAFTRGSSDEDSLRKTSKASSKLITPAPVESNIYQPGEKMPPLKYRRPVAPEHKAKLEAFTWAKAWRRRSSQSLYSPMGSRMPSHKTSLSTIGRRSVSRHRNKSRSRGSDVMGVDSGFGGSVDDSRPERVRENSEEVGDVMNVGLSRHTTIDPRKEQRKSSETHRGSESTKSGSSHPATTNLVDNRGRRPSVPILKGELPFSPEELELALKRSHLQAPPEEESDRRSYGSPVSPGISPSAPGLRPREIMFAT
ncbi:hypothetical protein K504DRAFT_367459 [Pleomassaria siparia CBS 279.74]|uniref:Uncharacterized protein n=1 Tax=Pleomassaria siparia CBS 279.74 TaxID=1314801 RepID=A0A6G1KSF2_9PLEO|nr:hypothetical protein K504DRAFT_367459 [Pleomassaria siparia CBS 279.74]